MGSRNFRFNNLKPDRLYLRIEYKIEYKNSKKTQIRDGTETVRVLVLYTENAGPQPVRNQEKRHNLEHFHNCFSFNNRVLSSNFIIIKIVFIWQS